MKNKILCEPEELVLATKEEQIQEAARRLNLIAEKYDLHPKVLKRWQARLLCYSFTTLWGQLALAQGRSFNSLPKETPAAQMLRIPRNSQFENIIRKFERDTGCVVYHALMVSDYLTLLYVSPYKFYWTMFDEIDFPEDIFEAYVHNFRFVQYSEFGSTRVSAVNGVLIRTE